MKLRSRSPSFWLRLAALALAPFWLGHTASILFVTSRGADEHAVYLAMERYRFDALGVTRSHWEFYRGYGVFMSVSILFVSVTLWQLARAVDTGAEHLRRLLVTALLALAGYAIINAIWFMIPPAACSGVAAMCVLAALAASDASLHRSGR